eukprot:PITA_25971
MIEEFKDDWSIVCSEDDVSYVYILTNALEEENDEIVQKMNICKYCSDDDSFEEEEMHYSDEYEDSETEGIAASTALVVLEYDRIEEQNPLKKIVKTNRLIYIPIEVQVKGEWINVDAFVDTGGSNNLARPSLFKPLWKPLQNILVSEIVGGFVKLTDYVDNIPLKIAGNVIKISAIQHYDPSTSLMLGMPLINPVLPVTNNKDKLIINLKKKAIYVPRLLIANSEAKKENSQKKAGARKPQKDSNNWQEVLQIYEERVESKNKQNTCTDVNWSKEQSSIHKRLLKSCSYSPQQFLEVETPKQEIITLHDNGVKGKFIPCTPNDEQEVRKQINELLNLRLFEPSTSHCSCSAFLVRNHSEIVQGKARMVINYKPVNAITQSFHYPLPRSETIMQKIQNNKIFSKFDMNSGYYQIQIEEANRHKTAFTCPTGFYQWKVVPFGLKNALAFFQRRMDYILVNMIL